MARARQPRVLLGLAEISGYYTRLKEGLDELGASSELVTLDAHPFGYGDDGAKHWAIGIIRRIRAREARGGGPLRQAVWRCLEVPLRVVLLLWAIRRFDVFVFGFRTTFLKLHDLWLLRVARKRLIFVFHGSDSRPPYMDGFIADGLSADELVRRTQRQKRDIRRVERFADVIVCNPLSAQFHERTIVMYQAIGHPAPVGPIVDPRTAPRGHAVRILHAPSNPTAKGTAEIRRAVDAVRGRGHAVEYRELTGRPNAEVLDELDSCDFVIDQLYSDISLSVFAAEAAARGKAPIVGGYGHDELQSILAPIVMAPAAYCLPFELAEVVEHLIVDAAHRDRLGTAARDYVTREWGSRAVAARILRLVEGDIPEEWLFRPQQLTYARGAGLSEERLRRQVRAVRDAAGVAGLLLDDKPDLLARVLTTVEDR